MCNKYFFLLYLFMEIKRIKGQEHVLYDSLDEFMAFNPKLVTTGDWRRGKEGDWVYTDDLCVCQILRVFFITDPKTKNKKKCIRTVSGSFVVGQKNAKIIGEHGVAENIYTFSGNYDSINEVRDKKVSSKKLLFAQYFAAGVDMSQA